MIQVREAEEGYARIDIPLEGLALLQETLLFEDGYLSILHRAIEDFMSNLEPEDEDAQSN